MLPQSLQGMYKPFANIRMTIATLKQTGLRRCWTVTKASTLLCCLCHQPQGTTSFDFFDFCSLKHIKKNGSAIHPVLRSRIDAAVHVEPPGDAHRDKILSHYLPEARAQFPSAVARLAVRVKKGYLLRRSVLLL